MTMMPPGIGEIKEYLDEVESKQGMSYVSHTQDVCSGSVSVVVVHHPSSHASSPLRGGLNPPLLFPILSSSPYNNT